MVLNTLIPVGCSSRRSEGLQVAVFLADRHARAATEKGKQLALHRGVSIIPGLSSPGARQILDAEIRTQADLKVVVFSQENGIRVEFIPQFGGVFFPRAGLDASHRIGRPCKRAIARVLGDVSPGESPGSRRWTNTTDTVDGLLQDSQVAADTLLEVVGRVADQSGGSACFGPGNCFITKGRESLERKVRSKRERVA